MLFSLFASLSAVPTQSIVGGLPVYPEFKYSWLTSLRSNNVHFCGGILYNPTTIITAGHCSVDFNETEIITAQIHRHNQNRTMEQEQGISFNVSSIHVHPQFNGTSDALPFDVAVWKVTQQGDRALNVPLIRFDNGTLSQPGTLLRIAGWGDVKFNGTSSDVMLEARVPIVDQATCQKSYSYLYETSICAGYPEGGVDTCQGDSGGPLFYMEQDQVVLVGLTSTGEGCAQPNYPGIYTNIHHPQIMSFIQQYL